MTDRPAIACPADPARLRDEIHALRRDNRWDAIAAFVERVPAEFNRDWIDVADEVAFALGQRGRFADARSLLVRAFTLDPRHRFATALAYVHYAALLCHKIRRPRLDEPEPWRQGFSRWIAEALRLRPDSVVDRYRLGVFHASLQSARDVPALSRFREAIALFEARPADRRTPQDRDFKPYVKSLYGAARSAFRLGRLVEARTWAFRCIRADGERHHIEPTFKLFLAARILFAEGRRADAERGLRLALATRHPGPRDFVFGLLAEIALADGRPGDAAQWIELHVLPHHRKPYLWRLLGDCAAAAGDPRRALKLYKSALLKDHGGRHKTLLRIGRLHADAGRHAEARRAWEQANEFRRRRFLGDDPEAVAALASLASAESASASAAVADSAALTEAV